MEDNKLILNLCGGKLAPLQIPIKNTIIWLDKSYCYSSLTLENLDRRYIENGFNNTGTQYFINHDAFSFLENTICKFDMICIYRFLEHVSKNNIQYFIYLLSTCTKVGGIVDIIVPDAKKLAKKLLNENVNDPNWESDDLLITYELVADQPSPHLSIWTSDRLVKLFEREGNFKTITVTEDFSFDGRDIYIRYLAKREK